MSEQYSRVGRSELHDIVEIFAELGRQITATGGTPFDAVTRVAVDRIAGAQSASITTLRLGRYRTESATDQRARKADAIQYELGSGPCVDAIVDGTTYLPSDLRADERWPEYGRRVSEELGVASMLSIRLRGDYTADEMIAGLNLYSDRPSAFTDEAVDVGLLLAAHGASVIAAQLNRTRVQNLEQALASNREIGVAIGILMNRHQITRDQGFDLLRIVSQRDNRKLRDVAADVVETGALTGGSFGGAAVTQRRRPPR